MQRVVVAILISALAGSPIGGSQHAEQSPLQRPTDSSRLRAEGLEHGYNLDYEQSFAAFRQAIAADSDDSSAYRLYAATGWISLLFAQGAVTVADYLGQANGDARRPAPEPHRASEVRRHLDRARALSEEQLKRNPDSADAHYQVGAAYALAASYTATIEGRLLGSVSPARRAFQEHQKTLAIDPGRKDAGLVVGLYAYGISALPLHMRLLARLAGFRGGRERAIRLVEEAAAFPSDAQPNALFTLALIYNREERYDDALKVIGVLQQRYPRNRLLWLESASTLLRAGRAGEARAAIETGLAQLEHDPRPRADGEMARWHYTHGSALVALDEREAAERELQAASRAATQDWIHGRIDNELGKLRDLAGDRPAALAVYRRAERLCAAGRDEECRSDARTWMKQPYRGDARLKKEESR